MKFSPADISHMKANIDTSFRSLPCNFRDAYRCVHCSEHIAITDKFCRGCGDEIDDKEKQLMKLKMAELAKQNTPALIGLAIFVLAVMVFLGATV